MTTRPVPLLARHSKTAPRFDPGKPLSLWDYFWDYEILSEAAQLDEATKIKKSIIYLTRDDADFWESLDEYTAANDWQAFKKAVLASYPGSIPKDRWTADDLSALCNEQKSRSIHTRGDFAKFTRQFTVISRSLMSNVLLSDLEARKLFWNTLDQDFKDRLIRKIELTKPAYTLRMILTIEEIRHAASLVLDGTVAETSSETAKDTKRSTPKVIPVSVCEPTKTESFDMESFAHQMSIMMTKTVELAITTAWNQVTTFYPASVNEAVPTNPRSRPQVQAMDDLDDRFSNSATAALSNTDATQTSSNLVEVRTVESIETHVEPKEGLDAFIAALQKFSLPGNKEDEGLEDAIQALKACISKKGDKISHQGPQEKRRVPMVKGPSIPISAIVPSIPAPAPEQPYRVQMPHEVLVKPADTLDLSREVTISVEELLALCPDVREYFRNATTTRCGENPKEEVVKASTVAVYLVGEGPNRGFDVVSRPLRVDTPPSLKPKEVSPKVFLCEESLAGEDAAVKARKRKKKEGADKESEVSYRKSVSEVLEEKEGFPFKSPHVTDPHRNESSSIYSHLPPAEPLDTLPSMCSIAPPVPACHSSSANHHRAAFVELSVVNTSPRSSRKKKSRPRAVKKIERLLYDPGGEGLVQVKTSWIALPAWVHRKTQFNKVSPVHFQIRDIAPQLKFANRHVSIVEFPVVSVAVLPVDGSSVANVIQRSHEMKRLYERVVKKITRLLYDSKDEEFVQLETCWIDVANGVHLVQPLRSESLIYAPNRNPTFLLHEFTSPLASPIECPAVGAAKLPVNEPSIAKLTDVLQRKSQKAKEGQRHVLKNIAQPANRVTMLRLAVLAPKRTTLVPFALIQPSTFRLNPFSLVSTSWQASRLQNRSEEFQGYTRTPRDFKCEDLTLVGDLVKVAWNEETEPPYLRSALDDCIRKEKCLQVIGNEQRHQQYSCQSIALHTAWEKTPMVFTSSSINARYTANTAALVGNGKIDNRENSNQKWLGQRKQGIRTTLEDSAEATYLEASWVTIERSLALNLDVEIEQNGETKRRYSEPRFGGWMKGRSLPVSGRRQRRQQHSHRSIPLHTIAEETRVAPRHSPRHSFIPTPLRTRRLQTRLKGSRGPIQTPCEVESKGPRLVGNHCIRTEWNVETKPRLRGLAVIIRKTKGGVWILVGMDSAVGKSTCRVSMPTLSCTAIGYQGCR